MADLVFSTDNRPAGVISQTVYTRQNWGDAWTEQKHLFCTSCTWSAAPEIPTAILVWRYGVAYDETGFVNVDRLSIGRYYVKIEFTQEDVATSNDWFGIVEIEGDERGGIATGGQSQGIQQFVCSGMETILDNHTINRTWWIDSLDHLHTAKRGIIFNEKNEPNLHANTRTFDGTQDTRDGFVDYWSSRDIVDYLLNYAVPTPEGDEPPIIDPFTDSEEIQTPNVPFILGDSGYHSGEALKIPDFDTPQVNQDKRRTLDVLNSVLARQRLLSFDLRVDEALSPADVRLYPISFAADAITLESGEFAANTNTNTITFAGDASASLTVSKSYSDTMDRVIVRGARRRNVGTFSYGDSTIKAGWTTAHQTDYNNGASLDAGYPAAALIDERQKRNASARSVDKLKDVYSRFVIVDDWDQTVGDGLNTASFAPIAPVYNDFDPTNTNTVYRIRDADIKILQTLPLMEHHDYSGTNIKDDTVTTSGDGPYKELQPLVITPLLEVTTEYVHVEDVGISRSADYAGTGDDRNWSGSISVDPGSRSIVVKVIGAPQHKIAKDEFTAADSSDWPVDHWNWRDFLFTLAIEDDRHCEGIHPPIDFPDEDSVRTLVIDVGDSYKWDFVAVNTIVGIDGTDNTLQRATADSFVRDDREALKDLAKVAHAWYSEERIAVEWSTSTFMEFTNLRVGDMVTTIESGDDQLTCNTVVTSISIETPRASGSVPGIPRVTYTTQFAELDPVRFFLQ